MPGSCSQLVSKTNYTPKHDHPRTSHPTRPSSPLYFPTNGTKCSVPAPLELLTQYRQEPISRPLELPPKKKFCYRHIFESQIRTFASNYRYRSISRNIWPNLNIIRLLNFRLNYAPNTLSNFPIKRPNHLLTSTSVASLGLYGSSRKLWEHLSIKKIVCFASFCQFSPFFAQCFICAFFPSFFAYFDFLHISVFCRIFPCWPNPSSCMDISYHSGAIIPARLCGSQKTLPFISEPHGTLITSRTLLFRAARVLSGPRNLNIL